MALLFWGLAAIIGIIYLIGLGLQNFLEESETVAWIINKIEKRKDERAAKKSYYENNTSRVWHNIKGKPVKKSKKQKKDNAEEKVMDAYEDYCNKFAKQRRF